MWNVKCEMWKSLVPGFSHFTFHIWFVMWNVRCEMWKSVVPGFSHFTFHITNQMWNVKCESPWREVFTFYISHFTLRRSYISHFVCSNKICIELHIHWIVCYINVEYHYLCPFIQDMNIYIYIFIYIYIEYDYMSLSNHI